MSPTIHCIDTGLARCDACQSQYLTNTMDPPLCSSCSQLTQWSTPNPTHPTFVYKLASLSLPSFCIDLAPLLRHHHYFNFTSEDHLSLGYVFVSTLPYTTWTSTSPSSIQFSWTPVLAVLGPQFLHLLSIPSPHDILFDLDLSSMTLFSYHTSLHQFALLPLSLLSCFSPSSSSSSSSLTSTSSLILIQTFTSQTRYRWEQLLYERCGTPSIDTHLTSLTLPTPFLSTPSNDPTTMTSTTAPTASMSNPSSSNSPFNTKLTSMYQCPSRGRYHDELISLLTQQTEEHELIEQEVPFGSLITKMHEVYPELLQGRKYPLPIPNTQQS